ncbi:MAG: cytochrome bc complex cytochrome b subunit [Gemmataceae bacterium]|nr:cytochrome bc complex cytochrome b subunit [Gemmataceae bacterium]
MITPLLNWLRHRSAVRELIGAMLLEGVPGGARWRYVWGSCLVFVFSLQLITGIMLMTAYSPSSSQAWNSVHAIQYKMDFGWLIRGLHHFGSQTMMVLIALHMLQVVIAGAHLPPRELNWWLGVGLLSLTLGLSLTGYLLPWDQKGYWATRVATNIAGTLPEIGGEVRQQAVGGPDYGNYTLTRFYALHVAILPLGMILLMIAHIYIFRRHGVTCKENQEGLVTNPDNEHSAGAEPFWPRQAFYDMLACMAVFGVMLGLVLYGFAHKIETPPREDGAEPGLYEQLARMGTQGKGAELDAAADRDTANYPARPEWYFLALFQLLKYFKGEYAIIGTVVIPNGAMLLLALLPLLGFGPLRKFGHFASILVLITLLVLTGLLTLQALDDDQPDGILWGIMKKNDEEAVKTAKKFQESVKEAEEKAKRACQLAMDGTPVEGGEYLMRNDPFTRGRELFQQKCGSCHNFTKQDKDLFDKSWTGGKTASDLGDFGRASWIRGLLENPMSDKYFGLIKVVERDADDKEVKDDKGKPNIVHGLTGMRGWRKGVDKRRDAKKIDAKIQDKDFDTIAEWLEYQAKTPKAERRNDKLIDAGQEAFTSDKNKCSTCHMIEARVKNDAGKFVWEKQGDVTAPDLTDWGSAAYIRGMIMNPAHKSRYADRNLMPAFRNIDGLGAEVLAEEFRDTHEKVRAKTFLPLTDIEREMIIRWITRDYRPIYGGAPIR